MGLLFSKEKKELAIQLNSLESICKQERKQRVSGPKYRLLKSGVCADRKLRINSPSLAKAANVGAITNYLDALVLVCVCALFIKNKNHSTTLRWPFSTRKLHLVLICSYTFFFSWCTVYIIVWLHIYMCVFVCVSISYSYYLTFSNILLLSGVLRVLKVWRCLVSMRGKRGGKHQPLWWGPWSGSQSARACVGCTVMSWQWSAETAAQPRPPCARHRTWARRPSASQWAGEKRRSRR